MNRVRHSPQDLPSRFGKFFLAIMGLVFLIAGSAVLGFLSLPSLGRWWKAQSWVTTECEIIESEVTSTGKANRNNKSSFRPEITYQYIVNGKNLTSQRYSFFEVSGSRSWANRVVSRFPKGSRNSCYYDPAEPTEAVLIRMAGGLGFWFALLFPWPFIGAGVLLLYSALLSRPANNRNAAPAVNFASQRLKQKLQRRNQPRSLASPSEFKAGLPGSIATATNLLPYSSRSDWEQFSGPQKLQPTISRLAILFGFGFVALFWNGILSVFLFELLENRSWFMLLFLCPFILIGLGLIVGCIYSLLALFNPRVEIALSEGAVATGETIDVAWEVRGWVQRIMEFRIAVIGEEVATYSRGTKTQTDRQVFHSIDLAKLSDPESIRFGTVMLEIPADTMHSHSGDKNDIVWTIRVRGVIRFFPDINEDYEFRVIPRGLR